MIAGSDTTASALSNIFFLLAANPPVYKRLQDEVDRFYPHGEDALSTKHHANMPYLEAVMCAILAFQYYATDTMRLNVAMKLCGYGQLF